MYLCVDWTFSCDYLYVDWTFSEMRTKHWRSHCRAHSERRKKTLKCTWIWSKKQRKYLYKEYNRFARTIPSERHPHVRLYEVVSYPPFICGHCFIVCKVMQPNGLFFRLWRSYRSQQIDYFCQVIQTESYAPVCVSVFKQFSTTF